MDEVKIWAIGDDSEAVGLKSKGEMDTEELLEETLVKNPNLLMEGLTLVGRQTETGGGPLDLLGLDDAGRLIVFELKPGALYREAVAQVIDYASALDEKEPQDLARHIAASSGRHGIEKIENFEDWYKERFPGKGIEQLKPIRMFVVGLGANAATERMVTFLANHRMDISLLSFHGFVYDGKTLLARQVQVEGVSDVEGSSSSRPNEHERLERLEGRAKELGTYGLLDAVRQMFVATWQQVVQRKPSDLYQVATTTRLNFNLWDRVSSGNFSARAYLAIELDDDRNGIRVCFYPRAINSCKDDFDQLDPAAIPFERQPPRNAATTERVTDEILFPLSSIAEWETHQEKLTSLVQVVYEAWLRREQAEEQPPTEQELAPHD